MVVHTSKVAGMLRDFYFWTGQARHREGVAKFQTQLQEARKIIEDLEAGKVLAIAEAKQHMHVTLEEKDQELTQARDALQTLRTQNEELADKIQKTEQAGKKCE